MTFARTAVAAGIFAATASAAFDPASQTNVVTYWGQGSYQQRLLETCKNTNVDVVNIGFVDVFPDSGPGGYPGTNFGNACYGDVYENKGVNTTLLKTCPNIGEDVIACQQMGKKVFLSLGGGTPNNQYLESDASGKKFADFLWGAFGPHSGNHGEPRPWGDAVVDGFDFDIESVIKPAPKDSNGNTIADYETRGYAAMINHLKNDLYPTEKSKSFYISGAPQCPIPDVHFTTVIAEAHFDFLWIQFYNNPGCSARAGADFAMGKPTNGANINIRDWFVTPSKNQDIKMYMGIVGNGKVDGDANYITPFEAQTLVQKYHGSSRFGGIMSYDATSSMNNTLCGKDYLTWMKEILVSEQKESYLDTSMSNCPKPTSTHSAAPTSTPTPVLSPNGQCGQVKDAYYTCKGYVGGECCSQYGYCGGSAEYCGTDSCNNAFGICGPSGITKTSSATSMKPTTTSSKTPVTSSATTTSESSTASTTAESTTSESSTAASTTAASTTAESTTAESTTAESTTAESTTAESTTAESTTAESTTAESTTASSTTAESTTAESTTAESTTAETSSPITTSATGPVTTGYTTFLSTCTETSNGSTYQTVHTHSKPLTSPTGGETSSATETSSVPETPSATETSSVPETSSATEISSVPETSSATVTYSATETSSVPETTVTVITSEYTTLCPVTETKTAGTETITSVYTTVSTAITELTSTITPTASVSKTESSETPITTSAPGEYTVTVITSEYTTICPVTETQTKGTETVTSVYSTVSTATTEITSTVTPTVPVTETTETPATTSPGAYTITEITSVYTTICPVTETQTTGETTVTSVYQTTSTFTSVETSTVTPTGYQTIETTPVETTPAQTTPVETTPAQSTPVVSNTGSGSVPWTYIPATNTPSGSVPVNTNTETNTQYVSTTSTITNTLTATVPATNTGVWSSAYTGPASSGPAGPGYNGPSSSGPAGPGYSSPASSGPAGPGYNGPASSGPATGVWSHTGVWSTAIGSPSLVSTVYVQPMQSTPAVQPTMPSYPMGNNGTAVGPSGTAAPTGWSTSTPPPYTGAASTMGMNFAGVLIAGVAAVMML